MQSGAKGRGRARSFASALGGSSRALAALRARRLGVDNIKAHLGSFLRSAQEKVQTCVTKEL